MAGIQLNSDGGVPRNPYSERFLESGSNDFKTKVVYVLLCCTDGCFKCPEFGTAHHPLRSHLNHGDVHLYIDDETMLSEEGTTQGDPLAMAMYAIGILPLIQKLSSERTKQVWYADDAAAYGDLSHLRSWWDQLAEVGPTYGYHPNALKT